MQERNGIEWGNTSNYHHPGRLEVVLDRSWETKSITWSGLTWWDPLPCGSDLLEQVNRPNLPLPMPSPSLSMLCHPPSPQRKAPPTISSLRSSLSNSPGLSYSSSSPLAWPLPPSPDSYNSVFLPSPSSTPDYLFLPHTPTSPPYMYSNRKYISTSAPQPKMIAPPKEMVTPPDSEDKGKSGCSQFRVQRRIFHFPQVSPPSLPPPISIPPPLPFAAPPPPGLTTGPGLTSQTSQPRYQFRPMMREV